MALKEKLLAVHYTEDRINMKLERIQRLHAISESCTARIGAAGKGNGKSKFEEVLTKMDALQEEMMTDLEELIEREEFVYRLIDHIESPLGRTIFEMRYLNYMKWDDIAKRVGYSTRYVQRKHDRILEKLEEEQDAR